jgi:hypothetical protein
MQHEDWRVGTCGEAVRKTVIVCALRNGWYTCNCDDVKQESRCYNDPIDSCIVMEFAEVLSLPYDLPAFNEISQ